MHTIATLSSASSDAYPSGYGDCDTDTIASAADGNLIPVRREVYGGGRIFDISHRYTPDMPAFESDDGIGQILWLPKSMKNGSISNNSDMKLPAHTGTHVDSPGHVFDHYFDAGFDVDTLDLEVLNGMEFLVSTVAVWFLRKMMGENSSSFFSLFLGNQTGIDERNMFDEMTSCLSITLTMTMFIFNRSCTSS